MLPPMLLSGLGVLVTGLAIGVPALAVAPQDRARIGGAGGETPVAAKVREQVAALGDPERRAAAIAALAGLGTQAVPVLGRELETEAGRGVTPQVEGIAEALGRIGEAGRPPLVALAGRSIPMREVALAALALSRGESGWTWIADYSENEVTAVDAAGVVREKLENIYGAWDVDVLENGNLLVTEFALNRVVEMDRTGRIAWSYEALRNPYEADRLPNGNTLIANTFGGGVVEVTRDGKVVFESAAVAKAASVERLANGRTLVAGLNGRVCELDEKGAVVFELAVRGGIYDAKALDNGNLLVALRTAHRVVELDREGAEVWSIGGLQSPSGALRLRNGNTLVAENQQVREFDPRGQVVWMHAVAWAVDVDRHGSRE